MTGLRRLDDAEIEDNLIENRCPDCGEFESECSCEEEDTDLGDCPYLARWYRLPGADPEAICGYGCSEEPECVTCEPPGGWPSRQRDPTTNLLDGQDP